MRAIGQRRSRSDTATSSSDGTLRGARAAARRARGDRQPDCASAGRRRRFQRCRGAAGARQLGGRWGPDTARQGIPRPNRSRCCRPDWTRTCMSPRARRSAAAIVCPASVRLQVSRVRPPPPSKLVQPERTEQARATFFRGPCSERGARDTPSAPLSGRAGAPAVACRRTSCPPGQSRDWRRAGLRLLWTAGSTQMSCHICAAGVSSPRGSRRAWLWELDADELPGLRE